MADERELIAEREQKVGGDPRAGREIPTPTASRRPTPRPRSHARFAGGHAAAAGGPRTTKRARQPLTDDDFAVAGRIVAYRSFGKAAFAKLRDRTGEIQVWVRKDLVGDAAFELWKQVERGDFIGAVGSPAITKTGELTIVAESVADPDQGDAPAAREVARPVGRRDPLPPALRRPGGQPRGARGLPQAHRRSCAASARFLDARGFSRSRRR